MARYTCPICGDPNVYMFWVDPQPPEGCPDDMEWQEGRAISVRNVGECRRQRENAWQAAEFRKLVPDAFDKMGHMKPRQLARVLALFAEAHPGVTIKIG